MTWGVEGRSLAVEGEGFVNVPLFLCKYRGDRGKPLRGEFFSSRLITCPLGSSLQNDATGEVEKVQLYISMDEGERWSNAIDFYHGAKIRWYTGLEVSFKLISFIHYYVISPEREFGAPVRGERLGVLIYVSAKLLSTLQNVPRSHFFSPLSLSLSLFSPLSRRVWSLVMTTERLPPYP